ncbi:MAG TPA: hypothetical protein VH107_06825 [Lacipirellulaceae bacterium]|jgi:hypothetical protein|nr:hypothetical protein [Lacipirellulaceae bacterium]
MDSEAEASPLAPLGREEYVEQAHFFRALAERLEINMPAQEVLQSVREEVLATTKLPLAIDFLLGELRHEGVLGPAMSLLPHYFTPFQTYIIQESENERLRFDLRVGLEILRREAEYRANAPTHQGLFLYQFEVLCRNRLGYDRGLEAVAKDPAFVGIWRDWIQKLRHQIGMVEIADVIYVHSEYYWQRQRATERTNKATDDSHDGEHSDSKARAPILFGDREGRIALANRKKDPLYLFSSLNRQLGYPEAPRVRPAGKEEALLPQLARRLEQLEMRLKIMEEEQRGGIDLSKFYERPPGSTS